MKEPNRSREELKGKHPYGSHYDASTSPNAQNMRETDPHMPLTSDNARVDLSTDPLSGLDDQNDTGSCTGAEFGGYSRYSNGYRGNPREVKSDKSAHKSQNAASAKKEEAAKSRRNAASLCLALAVSAAALGAAAWLSDGGLTASPGAGSETAELSEPAVSDTPADASQPDVPKAENFVLDYAEPEPTETPAETPSPQPEASGTETAETAETEAAASSAEAPPEEAAVVDSEAVSTPATPDSFVLPVDGAVTNPYSQGELVKSKTLGEWRTHDGIDFAAAKGTPVVSIADGLVEAVREDARWGNTVEVNYGDYTAFYYGLGDAVQVEAGQAVAAGQTIGEAGNSSLVEAEEAPHLHLGIKKGEDWVDPALLFGLDGAEAAEPAPGASDAPESSDPAAS